MNIAFASIGKTRFELKTNRLGLTARLKIAALALLGLFLAGNKGLAQTDPLPESMKNFEGIVEGRVRWVHDSTNWMVMHLDKAVAEDLREIPAADLAGKAFRVNTSWQSPTTPNPETRRIIQSSRQGQALTLIVRARGEDRLQIRSQVKREDEPAVEPEPQVAPPPPVGRTALQSVVPMGRDAAPADVSGEYDIFQVPIGGGGYSVDTQVHPKKEGLIYLRTDVAGIFRRKPGEDTWQNLMHRSFTPESGRLRGSAGLALHPQDPNVVWSAFGSGPTPPGGVYKSADMGDTWKLVLPVWTNANHRRSRKYGQALVVDPNNPDVLYYASQQDGLWVTHSGGDQADAWKQVSLEQIPANEDSANDARSVVVMPGAGTVGEGDQSRSRVIFVATGPGQIYRSADGGDSWRKIDPLPGNPDRVAWMDGSVDNRLFVAHSEGVARLDDPHSGDWKNITPDGQSNAQGVAAGRGRQRPGDLLAVLSGRGEGRGESPVWRSRDFGDTWERDYASAKGDLPYGDNFGLFAASCAVNWDPHNPGAAFVNDAYSVWHTRDIWADPVVWDGMYRGHEQTIVYDALSVPGGVRLITGMADVRGFVYAEDVRAGGKRLSFMRGAAAANRTGLDFCESHPQRVYAASRGPQPGGRAGVSGHPRLHLGAVYVSRDGGHNWQPVEQSQPFAGTQFANSQAGGPKLAVSATDPDRVVYLQLEGGLRLTEDGGATWQPVGIDVEDGEGILHNRIAYDFRHVLASDRVNGDKFYLYRRGDGGEFYRSVDGGRSFARVEGASDDLPVPLNQAGGNPAEYSGLWALRVAAAPGLEEEVWISLAGSGIWRASAQGAHKTDRFTRIEYFDEQGPTHVAWGKAMPGSRYPTVFVFGRRARDSQWGVWRSTDLGETWTLATPPDRPGLWPRMLQGDRHVPGAFYQGDGSFGLFGFEIKQ